MRLALASEDKEARWLSWPGGHCRARVLRLGVIVIGLAHNLGPPRKPINPGPSRPASAACASNVTRVMARRAAFCRGVAARRRNQWPASYYEASSPRATQGDIGRSEPRLLMRWRRRRNIGAQRRRPRAAAGKAASYGHLGAPPSPRRRARAAFSPAWRRALLGISARQAARNDVSSWRKRLSGSMLRARKPFVGGMTCSS